MDAAEQLRAATVSMLRASAAHDKKHALCLLFTRGIAQELGCESELLSVKEITASPSFAARQRQILSETGDPKAVVARLCG
jgi:gamma-glutamyl:cysteine ligase YbdK (ATP-grasp superfamily)